MSWVTSGQYANCCETDATERCAMPTDCQGTSVTKDEGPGYICPEGQSCATMTVFQTSPFGSPSATNIFCWSNWSAATVYRELPTAAVTEPPRTKPQSTIAEPTAPTSTQKPEPAEKSNAWIAGAVVGPVAGLALAGFGWFFYRRRNQNQSSALPQNDTYKYHQELDNTPLRSELGGDSRPAPRYELPTDS
ncbi:hypothetical protein FQN50_009966 [Emmonsiellopsis sp. PD_5]|nr:hypothetical protein FQN50_009966 [Emmonsiellopsis sp. PD_5]